MLPERFRRWISALADDVAGTTLISFAVAAPVLFVAAGAAVDYSRASSTRTELQGWADSAALMAARELRLGNAQSATIITVARNYVKGLAQGRSVNVNGSVDLIGRTVSLQLSEVVEPAFGKLVSVTDLNVAVGAKAKAVGGAPICMIGLDPDSPFTIGLDQNAQVVALNCAVYSNSRSSNGLFAKMNASMKAAFSCTAGGYYKGGALSFVPAPQVDCPVLPDPLLGRPAPSVSGCDYNNLVVKLVTTLKPGVYCGGLTIRLGAVVTLSPGIYIMKDGPLVVSDASVMIGTNVGFFLTGKGAVFRFDELSTITLTAPKDGPLAGLLIFEDRASPPNQKHQIFSANARVLLGTIYLPQNELYIGSNKPIADLASYTIVIARQINAQAGPVLFLNSNYSASDIPVPVGVGPNSGTVMLVN
ncbi:TadE/TadG family type IV pilus assembly protein [Terrarubrum flagellatum]|uniref:TadE/TadG family type IV pilus assembly protein n=1 Tax=Terrirubrum flagellatum TaxID=2895980 RepID=UPI00314564E3